ncbi:MAG: radical SAM protein [Candidatus Woesearchaeota archaeon]|nr:radical SAM protein [Candidatus Woesearchaeota archaeon]
MKAEEVVISATSKCNLHCRMCDIPIKSEKDKMSTDDFKSAIGDFLRAGVKSIVISGGEPLLIEGIFEIISFAHKKGIAVSIPTNGTLINESIAKSLKNSGVRVVNVSIDGPKHIHDAIRGKGNFDKALNALKLLRKAGIETTIAMTVSGKNYLFMRFAISLAIDTGATTVKFQPFSADFLSDPAKASDFMLSENDIPQFKREIEKAIEFADYCGISINPKGYLRAMPDYFLGTLKVKHCSALEKTCAVDNIGNVYACWAFKEPLGNLKSETFTNIWNSDKFSDMRKKAAEGECPGCLMSCYDQVFEPVKKRAEIVKKMGNFKAMAVRSIKRANARIFSRKPRKILADSESETVKALLEIAESRKILEAELKRLR